MGQRGTGYSFMLVFAILLTMTSCNDSSLQEADRSVQSISIPPYSDKETAEKTNTSDASELESKETDIPGGRSDPKKAFEEFDLSFAEDYLQAAYGKKTVNVYSAKYAALADSWGEDWFVFGFREIKDWCTGVPISANGYDYYNLDRTISRENIENVQFVRLNELDGYDEIARRLGISENVQVPCWTYAIDVFPQEYASLDYFAAPTDLETLQYAHVSAQYVDDLPVYGSDIGIGYGYATYEWTGVIGPSRLADTGILDSERINPNQTCLFSLERARYDITGTVQSDVSIVDPEECLDGIHKALLYDPESSTNSELKDIFGKNIEVYCAELVYAVFDPSPRNADESEEDKKSHDLYLIPVWEIYYIITDLNNEQILFDGKIMINAVTGDSLYSDTYGPEENEDLYPEIHLQI